MSCLSYLDCTRCGKRFRPGKVYNLRSCGLPLWVHYNLHQAAPTLRLGELASRPPNLWCYREVLPVMRDSSIVCLGEGFTALLHARRLGEKLGLPNLYLKDESANPTGSFKARGLAVAVSMAQELGIKKLAMPSARMRAERWPRMPPRPARRQWCLCRWGLLRPIAWSAHFWAPKWSWSLGALKIADA